MHDQLPVPFNRALPVGNEIQYLAEAAESGKLCGDGGFTKRCHEFLQSALGVPKVLLTTSCTHALEMSAILLDIAAGDEVIAPSYTFVSTINAFVMRGAKPVFVDVRPDTLNLDEAQLEGRITPRTKAIVPVHYAGVGCEMDAIMDIAGRHGVPVVEDNAHGLFGKYRGKYLGTFGCLATQSFHETKNVTCGEGGALFINEPRYAERAEIIREKGSNRARFFRGEVDKYTWVDIGSSYLPSDLLAAFLLAQLEKIADIQLRRRTLWTAYDHALATWCSECGATRPYVPPYCEQAYHMYYMLMPTLDSRQALIDHLKQRAVQAVFHYLPLHTSGMGMSFGWKAGDCPVTEDVSDRLVRLPFYNRMTDEEQARVIDAVLSFRHG